MKRFLTVLFLLCILLASSSAQATLVTQSFSGWVTNYSGPADLFDPAVTPGSNFTVSVSYDDAASAVNTLLNNSTYRADAFSIAIGGIVFTGLNPYVTIINNYNNYDRFYVESAVVASGTPTADVMTLSLTDYTENVFSSTSLPNSLNLSDFNQLGSSISISYQWRQPLTDASWLIQGNFNPPANAPVPEPATMLLLGSGLLGLAGFRKRLKL